MFETIAAVAAPIIGGMISADATKKAMSAQERAAAAATAEERRQYDINRADLAPYRETGRGAIRRVADLLGIGDGSTSGASRPITGYNMVRATADNFDPQAYLDANPDVAQAKFDPLAHFNEHGQFENRMMRVPVYGDVTGGDGSFGELNKRFTVADFWGDPVTQLGYDAGLKEGTTAINRAFGAGGMSKSGAAVKALTRFGQDYAGQKAGESYNRFYGDQDRTFNRLSGVAGTGQTAATNTAAMGNASAGRVSDILTSAGNARGAAAIAGGNAWSNALNTVGNWWNSNRMLDKILNRGGTNGYAGPLGFQGEY